MADVSKFQIGESQINVKDSTARASIGTLSSLTTTEKTNLVAAINELDAAIMTASYNSSTETISFTS